MPRARHYPRARFEQLRFAVCVCECVCVFSEVEGKNREYNGIENNKNNMCVSLSLKQSMQETNKIQEHEPTAKEDIDRQEWVWFRNTLNKCCSLFSGHNIYLLFFYYMKKILSWFYEQLTEDCIKREIRECSKRKKRASLDKVATR